MSVMDRVQAGGPKGAADRLLAEAASAADAARERLVAAAADIFVAPERRLEEDLRLALAQLTAEVVGVVEDDLRQRLIEQLGGQAPPALAAGLAAAGIGIAAPVLDRSRLLGDRDLVASLLRRAEAQRLAAAVPAPAWPTLIDQLMQSGDEVMAGIAMALIIAEGRQPRDEADSHPPARTDLPAELQYRLTWWVAAALRRYLVAHGLSAVEADRALTAAATAALAGYDEEDRREGRAMQLARRLQERRRLDDLLLVRAVEEGWFLLAAAGLALRAGIDFAPAWEMFADQGGSRLAVLLRATGVGRASASAILHAMAQAGAISASELDDRIAAFDWLDPVAAREAIRPWQHEEGYRQALADLAQALEDRR